MAFFSLILLSILPLEHWAFNPKGSLLSCGLYPLPRLPFYLAVYTSSQGFPFILRFIPQGPFYLAVYTSRALLSCALYLIPMHPFSLAVYTSRQGPFYLAVYTSRQGPFYLAVYTSSPRLPPLAILPPLGYTLFQLIVEGADTLISL